MWLYFRFTLSLRDVEEVLAERGIDVSYETVRCWAEKFGQAIAANIRKSSPRPGSVWHLDEMAVRIHGKRMFMWRAVDDEGEVLDVLVQKRRNKHAALRLLRQLPKKLAYVPNRFVTDACFLTALSSKLSAVARVIAPVDYARTTRQKTRIFLRGDESERCSA